jgi:hypothetical protein
MARYSYSFNVPLPLDQFFPVLGEILRACNFEIIYDTHDYLMGREIPGRVSFPKLVTVEALVDKQPTNSDGIRMNCVIKNEELPLKNNNHCRQMFDAVKQAIQETTNTPSN